MRQLRVNVVLLLAWLGLLLNVQWMGIHRSDVITPSSPLFVAVAIMLPLLVLWPRLGRVTPVVHALAIPAGYVALRVAMTGLSGGVDTGSTARTVSEGIWLLVAVVLTGKVLDSVREFEDAVWNISTDDMGRRVTNLTGTHHDLSMEMERARRHGRPLTVTVIRSHPAAMESAISPMIHDMIMAMAQRYFVTNLARLAAYRLRRTDLIVADPANGRVIVLSPEATPSQIQVAMHRLRSIAGQQFGIDLACGSASLPADGLTLDDLIADATRGATRPAAVASGAPALTADGLPATSERAVPWHVPSAGRRWVASTGRLEQVPAEHARPLQNDPDLGAITAQGVEAVLND